MRAVGETSFPTTYLPSATLHAPSISFTRLQVTGEGQVAVVPRSWGGPLAVDKEDGMEGSGDHDGAQALEGIESRSLYTGRDKSGMMMNES